MNRSLLVVISSVMLISAFLFAILLSNQSLEFEQTVQDYRFESVYSSSGELLYKTPKVASGSKKIGEPDTELNVITLFPEIEYNGILFKDDGFEVLRALRILNNLETFDSEAITYQKSIECNDDFQTSLGDGGDFYFEMMPALYLFKALSENNSLYCSKIATLPWAANSLESSDCAYLLAVYNNDSDFCGNPRTNMYYNKDYGTSHSFHPFKEIDCRTAVNTYNSISILNTSISASKIAVASVFDRQHLRKIEDYLSTCDLTIEEFEELNPPPFGNAPESTYDGSLGLGFLNKLHCIFC